MIRRTVLVHHEECKKDEIDYKYSCEVRVEDYNNSTTVVVSASARFHREGYRPD